MPEASHVQITYSWMEEENPFPIKWSDHRSETKCNWQTIWLSPTLTRDTYSPLLMIIPG